MLGGAASVTLLFAVEWTLSCVRLCRGGEDTFCLQ